MFRALPPILAASGAAGLVLLAPTGVAIAASASSQDTTFAQKNAQSAITEQTIGAIALERGQDAGTKDLAQQTITDHKAAAAKLAPVAQAAGITLPTTSSSAQQELTEKLRTVANDEFDLTYAQAQVTAHETSVASTQKEIADGQDAGVVNYAKDYLPVAQMHLSMAQAEVRALGGTPTSITAGSGGQAATRAPDNTVSYVAVTLGAALAAVSAAALLRRRRAQLQ